MNTKAPLLSSPLAGSVWDKYELNIMKRGAQPQPCSDAK